MGTGPEAREGFDLALTEIARGFLVRTGSADGVRVVDALRLAASGPSPRPASASPVIDATVASMPHSVETAGLHDRLLAKLDSPRWAEVAERCLYCTNCTLVCPTCFCTGGRPQTSDLDGGDATSERVWDSCMLGSFAVVAGDENFRTRPKDRYRQWLTHKFATWVDQFGTFGCVGCGRCIAWCPAGIDVREELLAIAPAAHRPRGDLGRAPGGGAPAPSTSPVRVTDVRRETPDMVTLTLRGLDAARAGGQAPASSSWSRSPGSPPAAISIAATSPPDGVCLTIRAAGPATTVLTELRPGRHARRPRAGGRGLAARGGVRPRRHDRHRRVGPRPAPRRSSSGSSRSASASARCASTTAPGRPTTCSSRTSSAAGRPATTST